MHGPSADAGYAIRISAATMVHERISIKHGDSFVLTDRRGDLPGEPGAETGFYIGGTRYLSGLELRLAGERPILLSSSLADDDVILSAIETNADVVLADGTRLPKESVLLVRDVTVQDGRLHERIEVMSYAIRPLSLSLEVSLRADFKDIFEVRGYPRKGHGEVLPADLAGDRATVTYRGLDQVIRRTIIRLEPAPGRLSLSEEGQAPPGREVKASWTLTLAPRVPVVIELAISGGLGGVVDAAVPDTR